MDFVDLERLDEGEFLNDNIISFALRQIEDSMAPEHRESVYFFNSFFYTALTTKNGRKVFNYDAVKRWTKKTDLLNYPFVVVPINIDYHWFVAIICNLPSISRRAAGLEEDDEAGQQDNDSPSESVAPSEERILAALRDEPNAVEVTHPYEQVQSKVVGEKDGNNVKDNEATRDADASVNQVQEQIEAMSQLSLSPEDERVKPIDHENDSILEKQTAFGPAEDELPNSIGKPITTFKKSKKRTPPAPKKYDPDSPTIITLDSFGSGHSVETRNLKDYLRAEADSKRGIALETQQLQGMTAKGIPEQTNFCDCGVYLVGYVEQFAKDPRKFITKVLTRQLDKEADFASFDPSAKRAEIRGELLNLQAQQDAERKVKKAAKKVESKPDGASATPPQSTTLETQEPPETKEVSPEQAVGDVESESKLQPPEKAAPQEAERNFPQVQPFQSTEEDVDLELAVPRPLDDTAGREAALRDALMREAMKQEEEEMLDSPEGENEMSGQVGVNAEQDRSDDSLLGPLEEILNNGLGALRGQSGQPKATDDETHGEDLAGDNERNRSRSQEAPSNRHEVIDLDGENGDDTEIPDSQEKPVPSLRTVWSGTHMKFDE